MESSSEKRNLQRTKHPEYLFIHTNSFQISSARHSQTNLLLTVFLPPYIWVFLLISICLQGHPFKLKTPSGMIETKPHNPARGVKRQSAGPWTPGDVYAGGCSLTTGNQPLCQPPGFAYLELLAAAEEGLQENHHVWCHRGKVFGIRAVLLHITEPSAHGVVHKQETGRLELRATEESQTSQ